MARKPKNNTYEGAAQISGLLDIIAPLAIDIQPRAVLNGDLYQRVLVVVDYPESVEPAWFHRIATLPGVIASIHLGPTDPYELIEDINISMGELEAKLQLGGSPLLMQRTESRLKGARHLVQKIDTEQQKVFYVTVVIQITAPDMDALLQRSKRVESILAASSMRGRNPAFRQKEGMLTVGPYGILDPEIAQYGARNMPSETIAAMYPFVYSGINDGTGILFGSDKSGGIILMDMWKRSGTRTNSNMTVLGRPGVGKSTLIKKMMASEAAQGTKIIVIDPEREYKDLAENLGGDWIDCGSGTTGGRINPLQVRTVPKDDEDEQDKAFEDEERGELGFHFQFLRTFFQLNAPNLNSIQMTMLEIALEKVYEAYNITWTTECSKVPADKWPILEDVYNYATEKMNVADLDQADWRDISYSLRAISIGSDKNLWNGHTTVNPKSNFTVFDIHGLLEASDNLQKAQFYNTLSLTWDIASRDRSQKVIIVVDEAYLLVDPQVIQPMRFLRNTSKRIRKYEGGLWVISQDMIDFMHDSVKQYGQALLDNPAYKVIMAQGEKGVEALGKLMKLSEKEYEIIENSKRGQGLLIAGDQRVHAQFEVAPFELELFGAAGGR